jgi:hypothetical protein
LLLRKCLVAEVLRRRTRRRRRTTTNTFHPQKFQRKIRICQLCIKTTRRERKKKKKRRV